jgi:enolase
MAVCTAGLSIGVHEVEFSYDGGDRFGGKGVLGAVRNVSDIIGPAIAGLDAANQRQVDEAILSIGGGNAKARLGGNAVGAVSAAVLKAGAAAIDLPLYRHVGYLFNGAEAYLMPVCGALAAWGPRRYGGTDKAGTKPTYSFICPGFDSFSEASYAAWDCYYEFVRLCRQRYLLDERRFMGVYFQRGSMTHDRELWALLTESIERRGYAGKVGIQVDVASGTYYDAESKTYVGLFSDKPKSRDEMIALYEEMVREFPFLVIEDPLDEIDYEGHAILTARLGIQIVGDDLFTTNTDRLREGVEVKAANTMLLKVYQIGTISEAFDAVQFAYDNGYGVMPCDSRGEGPDIADYTVGLACGNLREGAVNREGNRFLAIEAELGNRAKFAGWDGLKVTRR